MKTETIKGFKDYTGEEAQKRAEIKKILVETFEQYGFEPAETPVIEAEELVKGNNQNDEAVSDIYKLKDKGKRKLALRYEFTFQLKRIAKNKKLPYKRYQIGSVFRDEPASTNRFRQFTQCDADIIGLSNIPSREESELFKLANDLFSKIGIKPIILFNNRALLNEILDDLKIKKNKEKILRELDKLDKQGIKKTQETLSKLGAEKLLEAIKQGEKYFVKFKSYKEVISLFDYCRSYGVEIKFSPTIIRGLSYYNGTVFEVKIKGTKETICAGGSYIFNNVQCSGISFGLDRLVPLAKINLDKEKYLVISLEQDREAIKLSDKLRKKKKPVMIYYGKPSKALEYANSYNYSNVIFVGEKEIKSKKFKIKDMKTGKENLLKI